MAEYIERETAIATVAEKPDMTPDERAGVIARLRAVPAADVQPVRHGEWVYNDPADNIPYCSECMMPQESECNYCPSCGAKMDGWICETCVNYPPSACDGKPCTVCEPDEPLLSYYRKRDVEDKKK